jgi:hypothetical protein
VQAKPAPTIAIHEEHQSTISTVFSKTQRGFAPQTLVRKNPGCDKPITQFALDRQVSTLDQPTLLSDQIFAPPIVLNLNENFGFNSKRV